MAEERGNLRTYGRVKTRGLRRGRARLLETLLPEVAAPTGRFDPRSLAPSAREVWLEAGFGAGEHLAGQAVRHPDVLFLGAEPFVNGLAACLAQIRERRLSNVRVHAGDVRVLMANLPDASVDRLYALFPDPWPKTRHKKRRLIGSVFIAEAARIVRRGGSVRLATDWADYANAMLRDFAKSVAFQWTGERADDWRAAPADHIPTRYEAKRLGDCAPIWLEFERT